MQSDLSSDGACSGVVKDLSDFCLSTGSRHTLGKNSGQVNTAAGYQVNESTFRTWIREFEATECVGVPQTGSAGVSLLNTNQNGRLGFNVIQTVGKPNIKTNHAIGS